MTSAAAGSVARVRGVATGLLTAALALAAHGAGGGALPTGAATALLAILAATAGAVATSIPRAGTPRILLLLLAIGQLLGHLLLSVVGHHHTGAAAPPAAMMLAAHVVAIVTGAVLIGVGEHLWRALSRAVRTVVRIVCAVAVRAITVARRADQPLRAALLLAASVSHRGPPVSLAR
ncbi:hypothetical protein BST36_26605 [Mycolicibacterium moriokaense]|uniref:Uncharacterized protein n=1 Tax=Mycolicibacterium moriokaense TaxID=39691 RepID=A0AAD1H7S3_9MYCO|nr:hypothetical protein [Mycolicibacterium moriokaense]MCV7039610.1 hypothetical protein [Mycolicibacterium moriokaense]ORB15801.1 hypothetical protein BST36_26605 [Mycolicibacterium moriokaense]BBW99800.1 hypothetical protein MMOR_07370 [Mycolicibacterium moriokaense]